MAVSEKDAPFIEPYALAGNPKDFKSKGNTALAVKRALAHLGFLKWEPEKWDNHWSAKINDASAAWKRKRGLIPANSNDGSWGQKAHDVMRSAWFTEDKKPAFDGESQRLLKEEKNKQAPPPDNVPDLGPLWQGGLSILDQDLTHPTGGIALYPAHDDAFEPGRTIIAPENLTIGWKRENGVWVKKSSSSNPGAACYARGESNIGWWLGHLVSVPAIGKELSKGAKIGVVLDHDVGGGPHVHDGINIEAIAGNGKQLEHHTNYTHGAPLVGTQLVKFY